MKERYHNLKKKKLFTLHDYQVWLGKTRNGGASTSLTRTKRQSGLPAETYSTQRVVTKAWDGERSIKGALDLVSRVVHGPVMISPDLWNYLGGYNALPFDVFRKLSMEKVQRYYAHIPYSFKQHTMPIEQAMVSLKGLEKCWCLAVQLCFLPQR